MSGHFRKHAPAISLLVLSLLLLPSIGSVVGDEPNTTLADLAIMEFSMSPTKDGYQGYLKVKNIGKSSATEVIIQVLDEEAGRNSNGTPVVTFPFPNPLPDNVIDKNFKWEPEVPGTHVLRAIVQISREEREESKFNNVKSLMITLPSLRSARSDRDGSPDKIVFGNYISGIENMVDLEFTFDDIDDPSLLRVYATVPGHFLEYGTMHSGNSFRTSFDAGSLPAGEHTMLINSSYGGQPLSTESYRILVVERPDWYYDLERSQTFFDSELSSYVFKGRIDIPPHFFIPDIQGIGEIEQMSLFEGDNELFLSGYVLLDGTTTYTAECDTELITADGRIIIHGTGKIFARSPSDAVDIPLFGETQAQFDLAKLALGRQITLDGPYGGPINIPIPSLIMTGTVSSGTILQINASGKIHDIVVDLDIGLGGDTVDLIDLMLPGYNSPRISVSMETDWTASMEGHIGEPWTEDSFFDIRTEASVTDLGLSNGDIETGWEFFNNGVGLDIAKDPAGKIGRLELSVKDGHLTHMVYTDINGESEVYVNNTYKSSPELEYLWDGSPIVVWTEAGYMEDRGERASSMRLRHLIGDPSGTFTGQPTDLFVNSSIDQHPSMTSDHSNERTALAWMRDMDGNISTVKDGEIFVAFLDGSGWSDPQRITEDDLSDRTPDIWFDPDGRLHLLWVTGTHSARYAIWSETTGWTIPITLDIEGSFRIDHASLIEGDWSDPCSLFVTSSAGEPYRLEIGSIEDDVVDLTTITVSDHYISLPSIIEGSQNIWNALWRIWDGKGGDLEMSFNTDQILADKWSKPLRLTSDEDMELSPTLFLNDDGSYTYGVIPVYHVNGNASAASSPVFSKQNLSWGADTVSLDLDPGQGSSPGTMIRTTVLVEYRGMTPAGRVRVDIYRILRDRDTGGLTEELWDSEMVEFTMLGQTQQVEFNIPVKEFQFGLVAVTGSALSGIPAHSTQEFSPLSALPDIAILTMDVMKVHPEKASALVELAVKNWGSVSSGPRDLVVQTSRPTTPLVFEGGSFEPLFLRDRDVFMELNSSEIDIPAGGTISLKMNISLSPGMNNIWSVVKGPAWLPTPESHDHLVIASFPQAELTVEDPGLTKDKNEPVHLNVTVENNGPWPLNISYLKPGPLKSHGLEETSPEYYVNISAYLSGDPLILFDFINITELGPGQSIRSNWTIPPLGVMGKLKVEIDLSDGSGFISDEWKDRSSIHNVIITSEPDLIFSSVAQSKVGVSLANGVLVKFINPTGYKIDVVHITLYNGFPHDNVIVSEAIIVELGPGESGEVVMHFPLEEGQYILTTTAEASVVSDDGSTMEWLEMALYEMDILIQKASLPEAPDDEEVNMDDVTTAGIITISSTMFVLLVASFFYRKESEEDEEEKE